LENNSSALDFRLFIPLVLEIQKEDYFLRKGFQLKSAPFRKMACFALTSNCGPSALTHGEGTSSQLAEGFLHHQLLLQLHFSPGFILFYRHNPTHRAWDEASFGGFAAPWKFNSVLSDAEKRMIRMSRDQRVENQWSNPMVLSFAATLNFICTSPIFGLELSQLFLLAVHS